MQDRTVERGTKRTSASADYTTLTFADFSFDFSGWRNLTQYITLAQKYNLSVNIRPGPFIDAEFEFGGFPWWLLKYNNLTLHAWNPT